MRLKTILYKARWIYSVDFPPIENGIVAVSNGKIVDLGKARKVQAEIDGELIDLGEGVLLPALINAHTHLELSALKGCLKSGAGFLPWVKQLLTLRESLSDDDRRLGIKKAIDVFHRNGTIAVGDWTSSLVLNDFKSINGLIRCAFFEIIGFSQQALILPELLTLNSVFKTPNFEFKNYSLGAHAPHTTSAPLIKAAKTWTTNLDRPLSIHVSESIEEEEFLFTGQGPWRDFLIERGKWPARWKAPGLTSVGFLDSLGVLNKKTVCVHLTRARDQDLRLLREKQVQIVACPRSNHFISRSLPPLSLMLQLGLSPALGTDSLASNHDLNLWKEMAFVHHAFPDVSPGLIFQMATLNGAKALALDKEIGSISRGKKAFILFLPLEKSSARELPAAMINSRGKGLVWVVDEKNDPSTVIY